MKVVGHGARHRHALQRVGDRGRLGGADEVLGSVRPSPSVSWSRRTGVFDCRSTRTALSLHLDHARNVGAVIRLPAAPTKAGPAAPVLVGGSDA